GHSRESLDRGHIDDRPAAGGDHQVNDRAHPQKRAGLVHADHTLVVAQLRLPESGQVQHSRVVHQHVDPTELRRHALHHGGPTVLVRDVEGVEHRRGAQVVGQRFPVVDEYVGDDHPGSLVDKPACGCRTLATCGTGYQRDLPVESSHRILTFTVSVRSLPVDATDRVHATPVGTTGVRTGAAATHYNDRMSVAANVASGSRSAKYPPSRSSSSAASNPSP